MSKKAFLILALAVVSFASAQTRPSLDPNAPTKQLAFVQQSDSPPTAQAITVGKFKLRLDECQLTYDGMGKSSTISFDFPGRCQFSRNRMGRIRVVKTGKTKTLLVESSREAGLADGSKADCVTYIRGVIVTAKEVRLSTQTQKVAQCLPAVWDEMMFHVFAAKTQSFQSR